MLSILIADHDLRICMGIQTLLNQTLNKKAIIRFSTTEPAFKVLIKDLKPDLVILGLYKVPAMDITNLKDTISQLHPAAAIIICLEVLELETIRFFSLQGVLGFISKHDTDANLSTCIESVLKGDRYLCSQTTQLLIEAWIKKRRRNPGK